MVAQICPIRKNDERHRHLINGEFQRNVTTISGTAGNRNIGHIPICDWTKRTYRDDQDGKGKKIELSPTILVVHPIPATSHARTERTAQPVGFVRSKKRTENRQQMSGKYSWKSKRTVSSKTLQLPNY